MMLSTKPRIMPKRYPAVGAMDVKWITAMVMATTSTTADTEVTVMRRKARCRSNPGHSFFRRFARGMEENSAIRA